MLLTVPQTEPRIQSGGTIHEHLYLATGRHTRQVSIVVMVMVHTKCSLNCLILPSNVPEFHLMVVDVLASCFHFFFKCRYLCRHLNILKMYE